MNKSVSTRLVFMATIVIGTVLIYGSPASFGQHGAFQQAQYGASGTPRVDLPSPASESSAFPSMDNVVPHSLQRQVPTGNASRLPGPSLEYDTYQHGPIINEPLGDGPVYEGSFGSHDLEPLSYGDCDGPAPIYSSGSWWWRGNWYTQADVVVLKRGDIRNIPVLVVDNAAASVLNNNDLANFNHQPGVHVKLGRFLGRDASLRDHMVEFAYLGGFDWSAGRSVDARVPATIDTLLNGFSVQVVGNNTFIIANAGDAIIAPFFDANTQRYDYSSDYNDFQVNYRLQTRPGKDVMALQPNGMWVQHAMTGQVRSIFSGMRFSSIDESVVYTSQNATGTGQNIVSTNNDMFGFHMGGELTDVHDDWSWGLRGNVGSLLNYADRNSSITSGNLASRQKVTDERLAWVMEAGIFGKYQIRPNLALRAGYDVRYYSGIALAPVNMSFVDGFPPMNVNGSALFQGGFAGFETTW